MDIETFRTQHEASIIANLARVSSVPDGVLHERRTKFQHAVVTKHDDQIRLFFKDPKKGFRPQKSSGFMSRLDIDHPFELVALYTQALLLPLLWKPAPERLCILGFGGGRLAMVLRHWFPELIIDCVEIDPEIVDISREYFGFEPDDKTKIEIQDAREFIETVPDHIRYDIILADCFTGAGHHPGRLSTIEFYNACKEKLAHDGVFAVNILKSDPLFRKKAATVKAAFPVVKYFKHDDTNVFIALMNDMSDDCDINESLDILSNGIGMSLDFEWLAGKMLSEASVETMIPVSLNVLTDNLAESICDL